MSKHPELLIVSYPNIRRLHEDSPDTVMSASVHAIDSMLVLTSFVDASGRPATHALAPASWKATPRPVSRVYKIFSSPWCII